MTTSDIKIAKYSVLILSVIIFLNAFVHLERRPQTYIGATTTPSTDGIDIASYYEFYSLNSNGVIVGGWNTTDKAESDASYAKALEDQKKYNQLYKEWCATHPPQTFEEFKKCKNI